MPHTSRMGIRALSFKCIAIFMVVAAVAATHVDCDTTAAAQARTAEAALATLRSAGWGVETGLLYFPPQREGHANNPSTTYGRYNFTAHPTGFNGTWRLGPQDALAWLGCTPPQAKYFSWRSYLGVRTQPPTELGASLGDSANQLVFNTSRGNGAAAFNSTALLVTTADASTAAAVAGAFVGAGHAASAVNLDALPSAVVRLGYAATDDILYMSLRLSLPADARASAAYLAASWPVYRLTAPVGAVPVPLPTAADRPRGRSHPEARLAPSLAALIASTAAAWSAAGYTLSTSTALMPFNKTGWDCIAEGSNCQGDNHDALYSVQRPGMTLLLNSSVMVVVGVNHVPAAGVTYVNVDVNDELTLDAPVAISDAAFAGSAVHFGGPGQPDAALLYAYAISRDCSAAAAVAGAYCMEVSAAALPLTHPLGVIERAYLQADARTGPAAEELLSATVLHFVA